MNTPASSRPFWRKSSHSDSSGAECVEIASWRKGSCSTDTGGACVEVAGLASVVGVRDSKDPDGPRLTFGVAEWRAFAGRIKGEELDLK